MVSTKSAPVVSLVAISMVWLGTMGVRATTIPGTIGTDTTWTPAGNPYVVTGNTTVSAGVTLTIEPGVEVQFGHYNGLWVDGILSAVGTPESPITFAGTTAEAGWWQAMYVRNAGSATLRWCQFAHAGYSQGFCLQKTGSGALTLEHCTFDTNAGTCLMLYPGSSSFVSANNTFTGTAADTGVYLAPGASFDDNTSDFIGSGNAVYVAGATPSGNVTWGLKSDYSVYVFSDVTVGAGATLTIRPGTVVKFRQQTALWVYGTLDAQGTAAAPVHFTDWRDDTVGGDANHDGDITLPAPGWWKGVLLRGAGSAALEHCHLAYSGYHYGSGLNKTGNGTLQVADSTFRQVSGYGTYVTANTGATTIEGSRFTDNTASGLYVNASPVAATGCTFAANGDYGVLHEINDTLVYADNTFTDNAKGCVGVNGGTLSTSATWTRGQGDPFVLVAGSHITIAAAATLTIEPGVGVRFAHYNRLWVDGILNAVGTPESPITFAGTTAEAGWWYAMYVQNAGSATLQWCHFSHAGYDKQVCLSKTGSGALRLEHCTFNANAGNCLAVYPGSSSFVSANNTFTGTAADTGVYLAPGASFDDNTSDFIGTGNAVLIEGGTLGGNVIWNLKPDYSMYVYSSDVTVGAGATLTIRPGTVVKISRYTTLWVHGTLDAQGTAAAPIHFTDWRDDTVGGDANHDGDASTPAPAWWDGVVVRNAGSAVLDHCHLAYAGYADSTGLLKTGSGDLTVRNTTLREHQGDGLRLDASTGTHTFQRCVFRDNSSGFGVRNQSAGLALVACQFAGNSSYGVWNGGTFDVDARNCWWGHVSGPLHPGLNPAGQGNRVSDRVLFQPWLGNASLGTIIAPVLSGTLMRGDTLRFLADPGVHATGNAYAWDLGDGRTADVLSPGLVSFPLAGAKTVSFGITRSGVPDPYPDTRTLTVVPTAPAADLCIESFDVPAELTIGALVSLGYTVANVGDADLAAGATWTDTVYLSKDPFLDALDVPLVSQTLSRALEVGASYAEAMTVRLGAVPEGQSYLILSVDDRWQLLELHRLNGQRAAHANLGVPVLLSGTPTNGQFLGPADVGHLYRLDVSPGESLGLSFSGPIRVYLRFAGFPTASHYDAWATSEQGTLALPTAYPGTWYALVVPEGPSPTAAYTVQADLGSLVLLSVSPTSVPSNAAARLTIGGVGFVTGTSVELVSGSRAVFAAESVSVDSFTRITAVFADGALPVGTYGIRVTNASGSSTLANALEVTAGGTGPDLWVKLLTPADVGYAQLATIYVEYGNRGDVAMTAPLLHVTATQLGRAAGRLSLDAGSVGRGLWSAATPPSGFPPYVQFVGNGDVPGVLGAGETRRIPVYFAGWNPPHDAAAPPIEFTLAALTADDAAPVDWVPLAETLRPSGTDPDAWSAVTDNLRLSVGSTVGDFVYAMAAASGYLGQLGRTVIDANELLAFELLQARGALRPSSELTAMVDLALTGGEVPLTFLRSFPVSLTERYVRGPLGRGWHHAWQMTARESADGTITLSFGNGGVRVFQPDRRGGYTAALPSDFGTLTRGAGGTILLIEENGTRRTFDAAGQVIRIEDRNGNYLSFAHAAGQLASVSHSRGHSIALSYTAAGLISEVLDSYGRFVTFAYDADEHLIAATDSAGRTVTYAYDSSGTAARRHALTRVQAPSGAFTAYAYDDRGRIGAATDGVANATYTYEQGSITATNAQGHSFTVWMNQDNLVARARDAEGGIVTYSHDGHGRRTAVRAADGGTTLYDYGNAAAPQRVRDALGNTWRSDYGRFGRLNQATDPTGKTTRFEYDARGNMTRTVYADGTADTFEYDATGLVTRNVKASGAATSFAYDAKGNLVSKSLDDGILVTFVYNDMDQLVSATNAAGTTAFTYTPVGEISAITYPNGTGIHYAYDAAQRPVGVTDHNGAGVRYGYDAAGRLVALMDEAGNPVATYDYDTVGQMSGRRFANGMRSEWGRSPSGQVTAQTTYDADGAVIAHYSVAYSVTGKPTRMVGPEGTRTCDYDAGGRLVRAVATPTSGPAVETVFERDASGRILGATRDGVSVPFAVDARGSYTRMGADSAAYDVNGSLTARVKDGVTTTYAYDAEGRMTTIATPAGDYQVTYDALGTPLRIVGPTMSVNYLYDLSHLARMAGEYDAVGAPLRLYKSGPLLDRVDYGGGFHYTEFDPVRGDIALVTTAAAGGGKGAADGRQRDGTQAQAKGLSFDHVDPLMPLPSLFGLSTRGLLQMGDAAARPHWEWETALDEGASALDAPGSLFDETVGELVRNSAFSNLREVTGFFADGALMDKLPQYFGFRPNAGINGFFRCSDAPGWVNKGCDVFIRNSDAIGNTCNVISIVTAGIDIIDGVSTRYREGAPVNGWTFVDAVNPFGSVDEGTHKIRKGLYELTVTGTSLVVSSVPPLAAAVAVVAVGKFAIENVIPWEGFCHRFYGTYSTEERLAGPRFKRSSVFVRVSRDPNGKLGPAGYGEPRWIAGDRIFPYRIDFENDPDASAPAQVVTVTDPLDANLDWSTFEITEFGFGDILVPVPQDLSTYETVVPFEQDGLALELQVRIALDHGTGRIEALFSTLDPVAGLPPTVAYGFLPPEDGSGRGQGHFSYVIRPRADLASGATLANVAVITFDFGEVIATNQVDPHDPGAGTDPAKECRLTLDALPPVSSVTPLTAENAWDVIVTCTGSDAHSGIGSYALYVRDNGGPWTYWTTTATGTAIYTGETDHTYGFYSVATDNAGNVETKTATVEASTTVTLNRYISVNADPPAGGTVEGGGRYDHNATAAVTATQATGYQFVNWTENGAQVATTADYSFTATTSRALVAHFLINSYTLRCLAIIT
jgi:YD repeat-containing protein